VLSYDFYGFPVAVCCLYIYIYIYIYIIYMYMYIYIFIYVYRMWIFPVINDMLTKRRRTGRRVRETGSSSLPRLDVGKYARCH